MLQLRKLRTGEEKLLSDLLSEVTTTAINLTDLPSGRKSAMAYRDWANRPAVYYLGENGLGEVVAAVGYGPCHDKSKLPQLRIVVKPGFRGKGLGTSMLEQFLDGIRRKGYPQIALSVERNNRALYWLGRMGFEIIAEKGAWLVMRKQFSSNSSS